MLFEYETERLILRILRPDLSVAAEVLEFYQRDRELFERVETDRLPDFYTIGHQEKVLTYEYNAAFKFKMIRFYVFRKQEPDKIIGTVCFHGIERGYCYQQCEVGYKFSSAYHHQGYAGEAIREGISIMFRELGIHRIQAKVLPENAPSMRLLGRLGFRQEGVMRECLFMNGRWRDHVLFSLINQLKG